MYLIIFVPGMLSAGWEVCIVENCDRGLRSQFFTIWTHPKLVNNLFIFFQALKQKKNHGKKTHASVTVTVVRDRKLWTMLRTNQIVGFVTVLAWKKIIHTILLCLLITCTLRSLKFSGGTVKNIAKSLIEF